GSGICLTIPMPRLEGVPIISGQVNILYHAHFGPISILLALQPKTTRNSNGTVKEILVKGEEKPVNTAVNNEKDIVVEKQKVEKQLSDSSVTSMTAKLKQQVKGSGRVQASSSETCDVYGRYGGLMYVKDYGSDYFNDVSYEFLRSSDPELAAIPGKVSTHDRRLKMKVSRPRSLDLSNWSVDSRSSSLYTSSGSEESMVVQDIELHFGVPYCIFTFLM
ncbi:uncharacterized protein CBL_12134, partial [Carabus blaptoides fortunei]